MPEKLWSEATEWARCYGINPVCGALGLSYTDLKKRMGQSHGLRQVLKTAPMKATFMELDGAMVLPDAPVGAVVEVTSADGGHMVLRLPAGSPLDPFGLVTSFLGRDR